MRYWPEGIDGRVFRLMAVIIHEIGHAVESGHMDDPFACIHSENGTMDCELRPNSFAALSWESRETYETLLGLTKVYSDERLRQPYRFVYFNMFCFFYCEEKPSYLMAADLDRIMSDFRQLPFPSLYSLANPSEDFAETWADYWQQSHFGVSEQILYNGEVVADSRDKWSQPAYLTKINFIKNLISKIEARQKARPAKKRRS